jgi:hypothetical protein
MIDYKVEHVCSFAVRGTPEVPPEVIGPVPEGIRVNFYSSGGGEVSGPRIRGLVRPVGGDWVTVRKDGVGVMDARVTLETSDSALILVTYAGAIDFGEGGYEQFLRGELPARVRLGTSPRFFTSHPGYLWLNRLHCFGVGEYRADTREVRYDVYSVC